MTRAQGARAALGTAGAAAIGALAAALPASAVSMDAFQEMKTLGPLAVAPATGNLETPITFTTAGGCPQGTNTITRVYGEGFPEDGENVIGNTELWEFGSPPNDRMTAPMTITLAEAVRRQVTPPQLSGSYVFRFSCQDAMPPTVDGLYGAYVGEITVTDGEFTAVTTAQDLPGDPAPKAGKDAMEAVANRPAPGGPDPEQLDAEGKAARDALASRQAASRDDGDWKVGLATAGGIILLGTGGALACTRRAARALPGGPRK